MQTLHPRFGPWILGRQKTQNANFASKVWALNFRQAEGPECKLCIQGLGLELKAGRRPRMQTLHPRFGPCRRPRMQTFIQGLGLNFSAGRKPRMQTLHPRFGPWILGRQKTQNANFASKVSALDFRHAEDRECKLCIHGLGLEFQAGRRPRMQTLHPRFGP